MSLATMMATRTPPTSRTSAPLWAEMDHFSRAHYRLPLIHQGAHHHHQCQMLFCRRTIGGEGRKRIVGERLLRSSYGTWKMVLKRMTKRTLAMGALAAAPASASNRSSVVSTCPSTFALMERAMGVQGRRAAMSCPAATTTTTTDPPPATVLDTAAIVVPGRTAATVHC